MIDVFNFGWKTFAVIQFYILLLMSFTCTLNNIHYVYAFTRICESKWFLETKKFLLINAPFRKKTYFHCTFNRRVPEPPHGTALAPHWPLSSPSTWAFKNTRRRMCRTFRDDRTQLRLRLLKNIHFPNLLSGNINERGNEYFSRGKV